jgi:hypothetical protein
MPLVFTGTRVRFEDVCAVDDALPLLDFFKANAAAEVDLSACTHLHTALLQLLLVARPKVSAPPDDATLARWVVPLLCDERGTN